MESNLERVKLKESKFEALTHLRSRAFLLCAREDCCAGWLAGRQPLRPAHESVVKERERENEKKFRK